MKPVVLRTALDDIERGYEFYERMERGLGQYFEDSIFSDIAILEQHAGIHRKIHDYHRMLATRFPFAIYYRVEGSVPRIRGVLESWSPGLSPIPRVDKTQVELKPNRVAGSTGI